MIKRKRFGQHFLISNLIAKSIVSEAKITKNDIDGSLRRGCTPGDGCGLPPSR